MPICIILLGLITSSSVGNLDRAMVKKLAAATASLLLVSALVLLRIRPNVFITADIDTDADKVALPANLIHRKCDGAPCSSARHIAYIKTHKTGSSTVANIFMDYVITYNLTLALPSKGAGNKLGWPYLFSKDDATPLKPDVLCYHSRFSQEMVAYMPEDTVYVTTLRDPSEQLRSAYSYFNANHCFGVNYSTFLMTDDKEPYFNGGQCNQFFNWWLKNGQIFDLGLDTISNLTVEAVKRTISNVDKRFGVVLLLERLDESLIVMRDYFDWSTDDVVYINKNFQLHDERSVRVEDTSSDKLRHVASRWNWADTLLYQHFYRRHDLLIRTKPEYYAKEVKKLRDRIKYWTKVCVKRVIPANSSLIDNKFLLPFSSKTGVYLPTDRGRHIDKCVQLVMPEVPKVRLLNAHTAVNAETFAGGILTDTGSS